MAGAGNVRLVGRLDMDELQWVLQCLPCVQDKCGAMRVSKSWLIAARAPAVWAQCVVHAGHRQHLLNGYLARLIERAAGCLEVLRVDNCLYVTEDALVDLARNPRLRTLSLVGCLSVCVAQLLEKCLGPCQGLRELSVYGCDLESLRYQRSGGDRLPASQALRRLRDACHCDKGGSLDVEVCLGCESLASLWRCATDRAGPWAPGFGSCLRSRCLNCIVHSSHLKCAECGDFRCATCVENHPGVSCKKCGEMVCESCNQKSGRVFVCPQCKDGICRKCCSHKNQAPAACAGCETEFCYTCAEDELTKCGGKCGKQVCVRCQEHIVLMPCSRCDLESVCEPCCKTDSACSSCDLVVCDGCRAEDEDFTGGVCPSCSTSDSQTVGHSPYPGGGTSLRLRRCWAHLRIRDG